MLQRAGICKLGDLQRIGAVAAYIHVKSQDPRFASLNLLWALAAGLEGRDWRELTKAEKDALKDALRNAD